MLKSQEETVVWKASKSCLINEVKTIKDEKKSMLGKIAFLEKEHFGMKKKKL